MNSCPQFSLKFMPQLAKRSSTPLWKLVVPQNIFSQFISIGCVDALQKDMYEQFKLALRPDHHYARSERGYAL